MNRAARQAASEAPLTINGPSSCPVRDNCATESDDEANAAKGHRVILAKPLVRPPLHPSLIPHHRSTAPTATKGYATYRGAHLTNVCSSANGPTDAEPAVANAPPPSGIPTHPIASPASSGPEVQTNTLGATPLVRQPGHLRSTSNGTTEMQQWESKETGPQQPQITGVASPTISAIPRRSDSGRLVGRRQLRRDVYRCATAARPREPPTALSPTSSSAIKDGRTRERRSSRPTLPPLHGGGRASIRDAAEPGCGSPFARSQTGVLSPQSTTFTGSADASEVPSLQMSLTISDSAATVPLPTSSGASELRQAAMKRSSRFPLTQRRLNTSTSRRGYDRLTALDNSGSTAGEGSLHSGTWPATHAIPATVALAADNSGSYTSTSGVSQSTIPTGELASLTQGPVTPTPTIHNAAGHRLAGSTTPPPDSLQPQGRGPSQQAIISMPKRRAAPRTQLAPSPTCLQNSALASDPAAPNSSILAKATPLSDAPLSFPPKLTPTAAASPVSRQSIDAVQLNASRPILDDHPSNDPLAADAPSVASAASAAVAKLTAAAAAAAMRLSSSLSSPAVSSPLSAYQQTASSHEILNSPTPTHFSTADNFSDGRDQNNNSNDGATNYMRQPSKPPSVISQAAGVKAAMRSPKKAATTITNATAVVHRLVAPAPILTPRSHSLHMHTQQQPKVIISGRLGSPALESNSSRREASPLGSNRQVSRRGGRQDAGVPGCSVVLIPVESAQSPTSSSSLSDIKREVQQRFGRGDDPASTAQEEDVQLQEVLTDFLVCQASPATAPSSAAADVAPSIPTPTAIAPTAAKELRGLTDDGAGSPASPARTRTSESFNTASPQQPGSTSFLYAAIPPINTGEGHTALSPQTLPKAASATTSRTASPASKSPDPSAASTPAKGEAAVAQWRHSPQDSTATPSSPTRSVLGQRASLLSKESRRRNLPLSPTKNSTAPAPARHTPPPPPRCTIRPKRRLSITQSTTTAPPPPVPRPRQSLKPGLPFSPAAEASVTHDAYPQPTPSSTLGIAAVSALGYSVADGGSRISVSHCFSALYSFWAKGIIRNRNGSGIGDSSSGDAATTTTTTTTTSGVYPSLESKRSSLDSTTICIPSSTLKPLPPDCPFDRPCDKLGGAAAVEEQQTSAMTCMLDHANPSRCRRSSLASRRWTSSIAPPDGPEKLPSPPGSHIETVLTASERGDEVGTVAPPLPLAVLKPSEIEAMRLADYKGPTAHPSFGRSEKCSSLLGLRSATSWRRFWGTGPPPHSSDDRVGEDLILLMGDQHHRVVAPGGMATAETEGSAADHQAIATANRSRGSSILHHWPPNGRSSTSRDAAGQSWRTWQTRGAATQPAQTSRVDRPDHSSLRVVVVPAATDFGPGDSISPTTRSASTSISDLPGIILEPEAGGVSPVMAQVIPPPRRVAPPVDGGDGSPYQPLSFRLYSSPDNRVSSILQSCTAHPRLLSQPFLADGAVTSNGEGKDAEPRTTEPDRAALQKKTPSFPLSPPPLYHQLTAQASTSVSGGRGLGETQYDSDSLLHAGLTMDAPSSPHHRGRASLNRTPSGHHDGGCGEASMEVPVGVGGNWPIGNGRGILISRSLRKKDADLIRSGYFNGTGDHVVPSMTTHHTPLTFVTGEMGSVSAATAAGSIATSAAPAAAVTAANVGSRRAGRKIRATIATEPPTLALPQPVSSPSVASNDVSGVDVTGSSSVSAGAREGVVAEGGMHDLSTNSSLLQWSPSSQVGLPQPNLLAATRHTAMFSGRGADRWGDEYAQQHHQQSSRAHGSLRSRGDLSSVGGSICSRVSAVHSTSGKGFDWAGSFVGSVATMDDSSISAISSVSET